MSLIKRRLNICEPNSTAATIGLRAAHEATLSMRSPEWIVALNHIDERSFLVCTHEGLYGRASKTIYYRFSLE